MHDETTENTLADHLRAQLGLSDNAVDWLVSVFRSAQTLDDYADGDEVSRGRLDQLIWDCLAGCYLNPWFRANADQLIPVLACAILQWKASDTMEREGHADARSFVWRASFYQLVLMAVMIDHGPKMAMDCGHAVAQLYGEKLEDYLKEFGHA